MKQKLHTYKVHISRQRKYKVRAYSVEGAKRQAWATIAGGFTYGYKNRSDFMRRVRVDRLD